MLLETDWWIDNTNNHGKWECRSLDTLLNTKYTTCHYFCHDQFMYEQLMALKLILGTDLYVHRWDFGEYPKACVDAYGNLHRSVFHRQPNQADLRNNRSLKEFV